MTNVGNSWSIDHEIDAIITASFDQVGDGLLSSLQGKTGSKTRQCGSDAIKDT